MTTPTGSTSRRQWLQTAGAVAAGAAFMTSASPAQAAAPTAKDFRFCLNMSTIRGQNLDAAEEIEVAAKAGYDGIEPWIRKLREYLDKKQGSLKDLRKRLEDHNLTVESAIGFAPWIVDDPQRRGQGLEEAKRDMDMIAKLGGKRIAAPPAGVPRGKKVELSAAAERYAKLLEIGDQTGVTPQVEMWGGNPSIGKVGAAIYVAVECGHPKACFLGDVYHAYKGGSDFDGLKLLSPQALQVFHYNDYPADPPRETIGDRHRVFPGDGIAPLTEILQNFLAVGAAPVLSLELFNPEYWKMNALEAAKIGIEKMKASVAKLG